MSAENGSVLMSDVQSELTGWWQELLSLEHVEMDDDFFALGGDSLLGAQLLSKISGRYEAEFGLSILFDARTVRQLAAAILQASTSNDAARQPWCKLLPLQPNGSRPPLFWIPGGNGTSVLSFQEVSFLLGSDQPSYGLEARMPGEDEEFESIPERAKRFISEVRKVQPEGPYSLIGFCGGGFIAYEMAQQLSADRQKVAFLAILECADERHPSGLRGKARFLTDRGIWRSKRFFDRGPRGMALWIEHWVGSAGRTIQFRANRMKSVVLGRPIPALPVRPPDIYEKARRIVDRYTPMSYTGRSLVIVGRDTYPYRGLSSSVDPRLIWCTLCKGGSEVRTVPGDHTDMLKPPIVYELAEELKACLAAFPRNASA